MAQRFFNKAGFKAVSEMKLSLWVLGMHAPCKVNLVQEILEQPLGVACKRRPMSCLFECHENTLAYFVTIPPMQKRFPTRSFNLPSNAAGFSISYAQWLALYNLKHEVVNPPVIFSGELLVKNGRLPEALALSGGRSPRKDSGSKLNEVDPAWTGAFLDKSNPILPFHYLGRASRTGLEELSRYVRSHGNIVSDQRRPFRVALPGATRQDRR